jgi:RimJ/RimL family protein N-acetyltransferase
MTTTLEIRILSQDDAGELFRLRRSALLDSPRAFLASPEDDAASSEDAVRGLLAPKPNSVVFGAFTPGPGLIGMLGLHRAQQRKAAHKVNLWGAFVLPEYRGQGAAAQLLAAAVRYARTLDGVTSMHLGVSESAVAARRLYEKFGFEAWGVEPDAIRFEGRSESEQHMRLSLKEGV